MFCECPLFLEPSRYENRDIGQLFDSVPVDERNTTSVTLRDDGTFVGTPQNCTNTISDYWAGSCISWETPAERAQRKEQEFGNSERMAAFLISNRDHSYHSTLVDHRRQNDGKIFLSFIARDIAKIKSFPAASSGSYGAISDGAIGSPLTNTFEAVDERSSLMPASGYQEKEAPFSPDPFGLDSQTLESFINAVKAFDTTQSYLSLQDRANIVLSDRAFPHISNAARNALFKVLSPGYGITENHANAQSWGFPEINRALRILQDSDFVVGHADKAVGTIAARPRGFSSRSAAPFGLDDETLLAFIAAVQKPGAPYARSILRGRLDVVLNNPPKGLDNLGERQRAALRHVCSPEMIIGQYDATRVTWGLQELRESLLELLNRVGEDAAAARPGAAARPRGFSGGSAAPFGLDDETLLAFIAAVQKPGTPYARSILRGRLDVVLNDPPKGLDNLGERQRAALRHICSPETIIGQYDATRVTWGLQELREALQRYKEGTSHAARPRESSRTSRPKTKKPEATFRL